MKTKHKIATHWSIARMEELDGPISPIRIVFPSPLSALDVFEWIAHKSADGDKDFAPYKHFDAWPTDHLRHNAEITGSRPVH